MSEGPDKCNLCGLEREQPLTKPSEWAEKMAKFLIQPSIERIIYNIQCEAEAGGVAIGRRLGIEAAARLSTPQHANASGNDSDGCPRFCEACLIQRRTRDKVLALLPQPKSEGGDDEQD